MIPTLGRVVLMAALLLSGAVSAQASKPHRTHASESVSTPYSPAYRPDDQPEFPLTPEIDESRIAPDIWEVPPDLIGETRVAVFESISKDQRFLFLAANESRIGEDYLVLRCGTDGQYALRLVLQQPLVAKGQGQQVARAYRFEAVWAGGRRTLKLGVAQPAATDVVLWDKTDAATLLNIFLRGQMLKLTVSPLPSSSALLLQQLTLTFKGEGAAAGWDRIDRCNP